jgi:predicted Zn-dependent protease
MPAFAGVFLDGRTAAKRRASVDVTPTALHISLENGQTLRWPFDEVRQTQGLYDREPVRLERGEALPEALVVDDPAFLGALRRADPTVRRRLHDPVRRWAHRRLTVLCALGVIGILTALFVWGIPAAAPIIAARVPPRWEERLGQSVVDQLVPPSRRCSDPEREAVIGRIAARLLATVPDAPYRFRIVLADDPSVNAFAAPGGSIVVMRGLLERSRSAEELAGVLAHEIQHVLERHATRTIVQHASTALVLTVVSGDYTGTMAYGVQGARALATLHYSRRQEDEADAGALRMLVAARIDPADLIAFFAGAGTNRHEPGLARYVSTHPPSADRAERLRRLADAIPHHATPLFPDRDWRDVVTACAAHGARAATP